jgi:hypothetical protein
LEQKSEAPLAGKEEYGGALFIMKQEAPLREPLFHP